MDTPTPMNECKHEEFDHMGYCDSEGCGKYCADIVKDLHGENDAAIELVAEWVTIADERQAENERLKSDYEVGLTCNGVNLTQLIKANEKIQRLEAELAHPTEVDGLLGRLMRCATELARIAKPPEKEWEEPT